MFLLAWRVQICEPLESRHSVGFLKNGWRPKLFGENVFEVLLTLFLMLTRVSVKHKFYFWCPSLTAVLVFSVPEGLWFLYFSWILNCYWMERSSLRAFPGTAVLLETSYWANFEQLRSISVRANVSAHPYCARKFTRNVMQRCTS